MTIESNLSGRLLLVEDNPGDVEIIRRAFDKVGSKVEIEHASDGEVALELLLEEARSGRGLRTQLVLLDLNIPKLNGKLFLKRIKENDLLRHIPVVVLTSSANEQDIMEVYQSQGSSYLIKPSSVAEAVSVARMVSSYWFSFVRLPTVR